MDKVYFISGLGADYRLFKNIDLPGYVINYLHWIEPSETDTLTTYAQKLIEKYHVEPESIVIGDSLGGVLTVEVAKQVKLKKAIVISSIKNSNEEPWYFALFRNLPVYKIIPGKLMTSVGFLIKPVFGRMAKEDEELFKSMLINSSPTFMKWAMHAILHWHSDTVLPNVYHITGNKDQVFDYKRIKGATIIEGGTHIMIFDKAKEINALLMDILKS